MAQSPEPMQRKPSNPTGLMVIIAACAFSVGLFGGFVFTAMHIGRAPCTQAEKTQQEIKADVAAHMIRLGALNWMAACAYHSGLQKRTQQQMYDACTLDWGLGEPKMKHVPMKETE